MHAEDMYVPGETVQQGFGLGTHFLLANCGPLALSPIRSGGDPDEKAVLLV